MVYIGVILVYIGVYWYILVYVAVYWCMLLYIALYLINRRWANNY